LFTYYGGPKQDVTASTIFRFPGTAFRGHARPASQPAATRTALSHSTFHSSWRAQGAPTTGTPSVRWRVNVSHCINCSWQN